MDAPRLEDAPYMEMYQIGLLVGAMLLFLYARRLVRSTVFYYAMGSVTGIFFGVFLMVYMVSKISPMKLSTATAGTMFAGYAFSSYILFMMWDYVLSIIISYQTYFTYYVIFSASASCLLCYWYGPPTSPRTFDVMQWSLQLISTLTIYLVVPEHTVALMVIGLLLLSSFVRGLLLPSISKVNHKVDSVWTMWFPKPRQLLTEEEYEREGDEYTKRELQRLRAICRSPDTESFRMYARVRNPRKHSFRRLARFVEGTDDHISEFEADEYSHSLSNRNFDFSDDADDFYDGYENRRSYLATDDSRQFRRLSRPRHYDDIEEHLSRTAPVDAGLRRIILPAGRSTPRRRS